MEASFFPCDDDGDGKGDSESELDVYPSGKKRRYEQVHV